MVISSSGGVLISVQLFNDTLAGESVENFTFSSLPPASPTPNDAMFLFHDSVINIVDISSEQL